MNLNAPNLFILGIAKSGTTTLSDALRQCPDVFIPLIKEPTYFSSDINYANGMNWYLKTHYQNTNIYAYRCDASPSYIYFSEKVAKRIQVDLPNQNNKFIIIFRNPIDRAYSHYWHNVHRGLHENLSFEDALLAEEERLKKQEKELNDLGRIRYSYFHAGMYAQQLKAYWRAFPREKFLLLFQENLQPTRFALTLNLIQDFLQIPRLNINHQHSNPSFKLINRNVNKIIRKQSFLKTILKLIISQEKRANIKSVLLKLNTTSIKYPPMKLETKQMLQEQFTPSIKEFEKMIDKDLSDWLK